MEWNKIVGNISKAVEAAQAMGEKAMDFSQKAMKGLDSLKNASEIVKGDDSLIDKGNKLVGLVNSSFTESIKNPEYDTRENLNLEKSEETFSEDSQEIVSAVPTTLSTPTDAVSALALMGAEVAKMGTEIAKTIQVCQVEETKRAEINARMEVEVTRINAISKLLSDYLNKTFDERAELFDNYFDVLDKAMASGDSQLMSATLGSINSLAAQSPFKNLADLSAVQQQLGQSDTLWDI